jgi:hypothetical protein
MNKKRRYFWMNKELRVTVTYKNHTHYDTVKSSEHGCFIDRWESKIHVRYNQPYDVLKQARAQKLQIRMIEQVR